MSITLANLGQYDITKIGSNVYELTHMQTHEHNTVNRLANESYRCNCRLNRQYAQRCEHIAAVLTLTFGNSQIPEDANIPSPADVAQMEQEYLSEYLLKLNRAHNVLTIQKVEALKVNSLAGTRLKVSKLRRRQIERAKETQELRDNALEEEIQATIEKDRAQLAYEILNAQIEDVRGSSMRTQSVLKTLRP